MEPNEEQLSAALEQVCGMVVAVCVRGQLLLRLPGDLLLTVAYSRALVVRGALTYWAGIQML